MFISKKDLDNLEKRVSHAINLALAEIAIIKEELANKDIPTETKPRQTKKKTVK